MIKEYLNKDGSLDYQKLYKKMEYIDGFNKKKNREEFYNMIIEKFKEYKKRNNKK